MILYFWSYGAPLAVSYVCIGIRFGHTRYANEPTCIFHVAQRLLQGLFLLLVFIAHFNWENVHKICSVKKNFFNFLKVKKVGPTSLRSRNVYL